MDQINWIEWSSADHALILMPWDVDIERIKEIPNVNVSETPDEVEIDLDDKKIKLSKETLKAYEQALDPKLPFSYRFKRFLTAQNQAGRIGKTIKDFALIFLPFGNKVSDLSHLITNQIKSTMPESAKPKSKSKTIIVFGLLFFVGLAQQLGLDLGLELSPDAQWVLIGSGIVGTILRLVTNKPVQLGKVLQTLTGQSQ